MPRQKRVSEIEYGTLPTSANPAPSNQTIKKYAHKTVISLSPPTASILIEYEQAIKDSPEDAELRVEYGYALKRAGNPSAGIEQMQAAVRLMPQSAYAHGMLAALLNAEGEYDSAISEYREALRFIHKENDDKNRGSEALSRSGLAEALRRQGEVKEARTELEQAIGIQEKMIDQKAGSKQELKRLKSLLKEYA